MAHPTPLAATLASLRDHPCGPNGSRTTPFRPSMLRDALLGLILAAMSIGAARAGSITTSQSPSNTLADGRTGTIAFTALTPKGSRDFVLRQVTEKSVLASVLTLPEAARAPGAAKVPAMVVVHGSSGVLQNEWEWAERMNALGIASFVIDNFTGRGIGETATDQSRLSTMADVAGALAALRLLATHPAIDAKRIGVIGFSRGGWSPLVPRLNRSVVRSSTMISALPRISRSTRDAASPMPPRISTARRS